MAPSVPVTTLWYARAVLRFAPDDQVEVDGSKMLWRRDPVITGPLLVPPMTWMRPASVVAATPVRGWPGSVVTLLGPAAGAAGWKVSTAPIALEWAPPSPPIAYSARPLAGDGAGAVTTA